MVKGKVVVRDLLVSWLGGSWYKLVSSFASWFVRVVVVGPLVRLVLWFVARLVRGLVPCSLGGSFR